jgi:NAD(P)-dependent dehydrogenase (short-subunit alcohol dehydrogenase family)
MNSNEQVSESVWEWGLRGRVALVSGGGSGIGRATARLLGRLGVRVGLLGRTGDSLNEAEALIRREGGDALSLPADVAEPHAVAAAVERLVEHWQQLDLLVANAGINGTWAPIDELTPEEWNQTLAVNLTGSFLTIKYAVPHLRKTRGAIVVNASVNGTRVFSNTGATAYACSKAAQVALVKMTALELAPDGVRVNVVCPGAISTGIHDETRRRNLDEIKTPVEFPKGAIPLTGGRQGEPEDVARLIIFLLSDAARHITGTEVWIDGGQSLLMG